MKKPRKTDLPPGRVIVRGRNVTATGELGEWLNKTAREDGVTNEEFITEVLTSVWEGALPPERLAARP
jgi:hypothetical protein